MAANSPVGVPPTGIGTNAALVVRPRNKLSYQERLDELNANPTPFNERLFLNAYYGKGHKAKKPVPHCKDPLQKLAPELRNIVWRYALPYDDTIYVNGKVGSSKTQRPGPGLFLADPLLRGEMRQMYYKNNKMVVRLAFFEDPECLNKIITFLETIMAEFKATNLNVVLDELHFRFVDKFDVPNFAQLSTFMRLTGIAFQVLNSGTAVGQPGSHTIFISPKSLRDSYHIQHLITLGNIAFTKGFSAAETQDRANHIASQYPSRRMTPYQPSPAFLLRDPATDIKTSILPSKTPPSELSRKRDIIEKRAADKKKRDAKKAANKPPEDFSGQVSCIADDDTDDTDDTDDDGYTDAPATPSSPPGIGHHPKRDTIGNPFLAAGTTVDNHMVHGEQQYTRQSRPRFDRGQFNRSPAPGPETAITREPTNPDYTVHDTRYSAVGKTVGDCMLHRDGHVVSQSRSRFDQEGQFNRSPAPGPELAIMRQSAIPGLKVHRAPARKASRSRFAWMQKATAKATEAQTVEIPRSPGFADADVDSAGLDVLTTDNIMDIGLRVASNPNPYSAAAVDQPIQALTSISLPVQSLQDQVDLFNTLESEGVADSTSPAFDTLLGTSQQTVAGTLTELQGIEVDQVVDDILFMLNDPIFEELP